MRPKNLIGGDLLDLGPGRVVEHAKQEAGPLAGREGGPSQRRHARGRLRSGHDVEESAGDAEADPLGLGDGGELLLHVAGDLHGPLQASAKGLILDLAVGQLSPEVVDASFGGRAIDGLDDLGGLAVERLAGLLTVLGHRGHLAVPTAEDGEGASNPLGDGGHGDSLRRGRSRDHPHDCTHLDANCPRTTSGKGPV